MKKNNTIAIYLAAAIIVLYLPACAINAPIIENKKLTAESAGDSRIAYGVSGQGETTLLFVHGWLCDHKIWQPQIDYFSSSHKVAWMDLAGHGDSETSRQSSKIFQACFIISMVHRQVTKMHSVKMWF